MEAKDVGVSLSRAEKSKQLRRYLGAFPNLLLTDYLEFRWYVRGEPTKRARLARWDGKNPKRASPQELDSALELLRAFLAQPVEKIGRAESLAQRMAQLTQLLRDAIVVSLKLGTASEQTRSLKSAFEDVLIPDIDEAQFGDMLAQTFAYGLFAARVRHTGAAPFRRQDAAYEIPRTNPFLRRLFTSIGGPGLDDEPWVGYLEDLTQLLAVADMPRVLRDLGTRSHREDPVVHFYETFLAAYDPALREARGAYYTPEPVVRYIVRSVDALLRERFSADGLSDTSKVTYTDARTEPPDANVCAEGEPA